MLSDKQINEIRERADKCRAPSYLCDSCDLPGCVLDDIPALLIEVDRLQRECIRLKAQRDDALYQLRRMTKEE